MRSPVALLVVYLTPSGQSVTTAWRGTNDGENATPEKTWQLEFYAASAVGAESQLRSRCVVPLIRWRYLAVK